MKWIAYGAIMSVLFLFKSVKNVILVNRVIKTLYAPGDKCDYVNGKPKPLDQNQKPFPKNPEKNKKKSQLH